MVRLEVASRCEPKLAVTRTFPSVDLVFTQGIRDGRDTSKLRFDVSQKPQSTCNGLVESPLKGNFCCLGETFASKYL